MVLDQLYGAVLQLWARASLPTLAGWLDAAVAGLPPVAYSRSAAGPRSLGTGPALVTTAGRNRLLHVEFAWSPGPSLVNRMLAYRAQMSALRPGVHLTQHVVVLGAGRVSGHDDPGRGFTLDLRVVYLRDRAPGEFLADPALAPLAALSRGPRARRERSFGAALRLLRDDRHPRGAELLQVAEILAGVRLDAATVERVKRESGMSVEFLADHYAGTEIGRILRQRGVEAGRVDGSVRGREEVLSAVLAERFGPTAPQVPVAARRLARWPVADALEAVRQASDVSALLSRSGPGDPHPAPG